MKTILVTGGTGFIGSHTCIPLLERGDNIIILDSLINSSFETIENIKKIIKLNKNNQIGTIDFVRGDIRDSSVIDNIFIRANKSGNKIDAVIHFAGLKSVSDSIEHPLHYWENNVLGSINLLNVMHKHKCNCLIFSSSATIYGMDSPEILNESCKLNPINPYGQTKLAIEKFLKDLSVSNTSKWRIACLRYFNPIGAHHSGIIGENHNKKTQNIFPIINQVAIGIKRKLEIFGNNYPTKDGTGIRDYIHVEDLAEGHIAALDYISSFEKKILFANLGTGIGTSVLELIKVFEEVNQCYVPYSFKEKRKGDLPVVIADNNLSIKILKWRPKKNLRDMCRDGWNWQKKNKKAF